MYLPPFSLATTLIIATLSILKLPTTVALAKPLNHTSLSPIVEHEELIKGPPHYSTQPPPTPTNKFSPMTQPSKRARRMGGLPPEFRTFALEHGWSITVASISVVVPLASDLGVRNVRATRLLGALFGEVQAKCAAHMLNNSPFGAQQVAFRFGKTELVFEMHPRSLIQEISWSFIYHFAAYMLVWVQNGFAGFGALFFENRRSGVLMMVQFLP